MSHEISTVTNANGEAAFANTAAWHGLGFVNDGLMTLGEINEKANLNWEVYQKPVVFGETVWEERLVNYRLDNDGCPVPLGVVSDKYNIIQNSVVTKFIESLVDVSEGEAVVESAAALHGGRVVFWLIRLREGDVNGDKIAPYLLVKTRHDGLGSKKFMLTNVRVVCQNTLTLALRSSLARYSISHTAADLDSRMDEARDVLSLAGDRFKKELEMVAAMKEAKVDEDDVIKMWDSVYGVTSRNTDDASDRVKNGINELLADLWDSYENAPGAETGTVWGALNSVTYYEDHVASETEGVASFIRKIEQTGAERKRVAEKVAVRMATR